MDTKDKAIIWVLYLMVAMIVPLDIYGCIIGAVLVGIAIKVIDRYFAKIIFWHRDKFDTDSRQ